MATKYHKLCLKDKGYKYFLDIKKRYYTKHNLDKDVKVTDEKIFTDYYEFHEGIQ